MSLHEIERGRSRGSWIFFILSVFFLKYIRNEWTQALKYSFAGDLKGDFVRGKPFFLIYIQSFLFVISSDVFFHIELQIPWPDIQIYDLGSKFRKISLLTLFNFFIDFHNIRLLPPFSGNIFIFWYILIHIVIYVLLYHHKGHQLRVCVHISGPVSKL